MCTWDNSQLEYAGARWEYLQKRAQLQQHQRTEKKLRQYCKYWKLSKGEWTDSVSCQFSEFTLILQELIYM